MKMSATLAVLGILALSAGVLEAQFFPGKMCDMNAGFTCFNTGGVCTAIIAGQMPCNGVVKQFNAAIIAGVGPGKCQGTSLLGCTEKVFPCVTDYYNSPPWVPPAGPTCNALTDLKCPHTANNVGC